MCHSLSNLANIVRYCCEEVITENIAYGLKALYSKIALSMKIEGLYLSHSRTVLNLPLSR